MPSAIKESLDFILNPGWFEEFEASASAKAFQKRQAGGLKAATLRNEPVRTGEFAALQAKYSGVWQGGLETRFYPRALWSIAEFGSVNNPAYRPITRAAASLGLRLDWNGG